MASSGEPWTGSLKISRSGAPPFTEMENPFETEKEYNTAVPYPLAFYHKWDSVTKLVQPGIMHRYGSGLMVSLSSNKNSVHVNVRTSNVVEYLGGMLLADDLISRSKTTGRMIYTFFFREGDNFVPVSRLSGFPLAFLPTDTLEEIAGYVPNELYSVSKILNQSSLLGVSKYGSLKDAKCIIDKVLDRENLDSSVKSALNQYIQRFELSLIRAPAFVSRLRDVDVIRVHYNRLKELKQSDTEILQIASRNHLYILYMLENSLPIPENPVSLLADYLLDNIKLHAFKYISNIAESMFELIVSGYPASPRDIAIVMIYSSPTTAQEALVLAGESDELRKELYENLAPDNVELLDILANHSSMLNDPEQYSRFVIRLWTLTRREGGRYNLSGIYHIPLPKGILSKLFSDPRLQSQISGGQTLSEIYTQTLDELSRFPHGDRFATANIVEIIIGMTRNPNLPPPRKIKLSTDFQAHPENIDIMLEYLQRLKSNLANTLLK